MKIFVSDSVNIHCMCFNFAGIYQMIYFFHLPSLWAIEKWRMQEQIALLVEEMERSRLDPSVQENFLYICRKVIVTFCGINPPRKWDLTYLPPSYATFECSVMRVYLQSDILFLFFTSKLIQATVCRSS